MKKLTTYKFNKAINLIVDPVIKDAGFEFSKGRKHWKWDGELIWCLEINSLGGIAYKHNYPGRSLFVSAGIYVGIIPFFYEHNKNFHKSKLAPEEVSCHYRMGVDSTESVTCSNEFLSTFKGKGPRWRLERKLRSLYPRFGNIPEDVWYIDPNGENLEYALSDLKNQLNKQLFPWFKENSNLEKLISIFKENNSFYANRKLYFIYKHLGKKLEAEKCKSFLYDFADKQYNSEEYIEELDKLFQKYK